MEQQRWVKASDDKSAASFADAFAKEIVLEAVLLTRPAGDIEQVKRAMAAASSIYEAPKFTRKATNGTRTYLE